MAKLKPPEGYETWLDCAVRTMSPHPFATMDASQLGVPDREQMRAAARAELDELRGDLQAAMRLGDDTIDDALERSAKEAESELIPDDLSLLPGEAAGRMRAAIAIRIRALKIEE